MNELKREQLKDLRGLAVVELYKPGCHPCEQLQPVLDTLAGEYPQAQFYKSNFFESGLGQEFGLALENVPTIVLLKDGQKVEHFPGARYVNKARGERIAADPGSLRIRLGKFLQKYQEQRKSVSQPQLIYQKPASLETELDINENGLIVLRGRYLVQDDKGKVIERPEDMFRRVAKNIASAERLYGKQDADVEKTEKAFYDMMASLSFLPNSPTLMNAGRDLQQLSACFVLPIEDSIDDIFGTARDAALVHKSGGGTGFAFSRLRPKNSRVKSTNGIASGPVSFMYVFNTYTEVVKQGGTRRGANMAVLRVDHPDIQEFIHAKGELNDINKKIVDAYIKATGFQDGDYFIEVLKRLLLEKTQLNNLNLSVGATKEFMDAVEDDREFALVHPGTKEVVKKFKARAILEEIVDQSWETGDPGMVFLDRMNDYNFTPQLGDIESTNPCGEQPLLPYESCNLGSINLANFVSQDGKVNYQGLRQTVHDAVSFLDNVIDMNRYPLPEIEKMTKGNRKIGLGVMGFADMTTMMEIPYGSEESVKLAEEVMKFVRDEARVASAKLGEERGVFPNWKGSIYDPESKYFKGEELKLRNATVTTIAPTGTISMIAGCDSGIEPFFDIAYTKTVMDGKVFHYGAKGLEYVLRKKEYKPEEVEKIFAEIIEERDRNRKLEKIPDEVRRFAVTARDLSPEQHIRVQAAFQKYTDNAVSKTINLPKDATRDDIRNAYLLAYKLGCKGVTVYRDESKEDQILKAKGGEQEKQYAFGSSLPKERAAIVRQENVSDEHRIFITTGYWEDDRTGAIVRWLRRNGKPTEFFVDANFFNEDLQSLMTALCISNSKSLREGRPLEKVIGDLINVPPSRSIGFNKINGKDYVNRSIPEAIGRAVSGWEPPTNEYDEHKIEIPEEAGKKSKIEEKKENDNQKYGYCKECGKYGVISREGCTKCIYCNYSPKGCD